MQPTSVYETALLAGCAVWWPGEWPLASPTREEFTEPLLDELEGALAGGEPGAPTGRGLMGSRGHHLGVACSALGAMVLQAGQRSSAADVVLVRLSKSAWRHSGTQGAALAIRALALGVPQPARDPVRVAFDADPGASRTVVAAPAHRRPLIFETPVALAAGEQGAVSVDIDADEPRAWRLGCRYRVDSPLSSETAPYAIETRLTPKVDMGNVANLDVVIRPVGEAPPGQVVARIGLPAGAVFEPTALERHGRTSYSHWEVGDGFLDLYWGRAPRREERFSLRFTMPIAGTFRARPAVVYPYYESDREAYAGPLAIRVRNTFGNTVSEAEAWEKKRRRRR